MNTKYCAMVFFVLAASLITFGCGLGGLIGSTATPAPTNTPIPPTATATNTPIPATPTIAAIPGSNQPIVIGDFNLTITTVDLNEKGFNGLAPYPMTADQTVLAVEVTLNSGDLEQLSHLKAWVMDDAGNRTDSGTTLSVAAKNQVIWLFPVLKTAHSFLLYFPSGEVIDLTPLLP